MAIDDIRNFVALSEHLATAGQPSEQHLRELAAARFEVIVNLGLLDPRYCLADEAGLTRSLGMEYHHVPVEFNAPQSDDLQKFFEVMDTSREKKVFVHCAANFRVSSFMAVYGEMRLGWDRDRADRHARTFWEPNRTWQQFVTDCRSRYLEPE